MNYPRCFGWEWAFCICSCVRLMFGWYLSLLETPCSSPGRWLSACFPPQGHYSPHRLQQWSAWWSSLPCDTQEQPAEGNSVQLIIKHTINTLLGLFNSLLSVLFVMWALAEVELVPCPQWSLFEVQKVQWGLLWCLETQQRTQIHYEWGF